MKQIGWFLVGAVCGAVSMWLRQSYLGIPFRTVRLALYDDFEDEFCEDFCEECAAMNVEAQRLIDSVEWDGIE